MPTGLSPAGRRWNQRTWSATGRVHAWKWPEALAQWITVLGSRRLAGCGLESRKQFLAGLEHRFFVTGRQCYRHWAKVGNAVTDGAAAPLKKLENQTGNDDGVEGTRPQVGRTKRALEWCKGRWKEGRNPKQDDRVDRTRPQVKEVQVGGTKRGVLEWRKGQ